MPPGSLVPERGAPPTESSLAPYGSKDGFTPSPGKTDATEGPTWDKIPFVERLPFEILREIFRFLVESDRTGQEGLTNDNRRGTLLLCQVCSIWRCIAISLPHLWSVLSLRLHGEERPMDWISKWLDRSKCVAVQLQLFWVGGAREASIDGVLSVFLSHLHHASEIWIEGRDGHWEGVGPTYPRRTVPYIPSLEAPILTALVVDLPSNSPSEWLHAVCTAAPHLARLVISEPCIGWFSPIHLTSLHMMAPTSMLEILQVLQEAPDLKNISFTVDGPSARVGGDPVRLGFVSSVELSSEDYLGDFLDQIALPVVEDIVIFNVSDWPQSEFCAFLCRSSCTLKSLALDQVNLDVEELIACLQCKALETLESLTFYCSFLRMDTFFEYLTYKEPPFPQAKLVNLEVFGTISADGFIASLAESRFLGEKPGAARLDKLRVTFFDAREEQAHKDDLARLADLRGAGLSVYL